MVNFNIYRCRNCKHWHDKEMSEQCGFETVKMSGPCLCANWQSNDNLKYLEDLNEVKSTGK